MKTVRPQIHISKFRFLASPQFWSITSIYVLITLHHYNDLTNFNIFTLPDTALDITRHTVDRILYLIPVILSSFAFGPRSGVVALTIALATMLPRVFFISTSMPTALLETFMVGVVGAMAPIWAGHNMKQKKHLELTMETLETTKQQLDSKVQLTIEQEKQLAVIKTFAMILSQTLEIKKVVRTAINMVREVMQTDVVLVFSLDKLTEQLRLVDFSGIKPVSAERLDGIELGQGLCGLVAKTGEPVLVEDLATRPELCNKATVEEGLQSQLSVALLARAEIIGTLCIASRNRRNFNDAEIKLLGALGNLIGIAVDNSRLFHEKELAATQLRTSETRYRRLFENAHDAIWVEDLAGTIIAANEASANLFGSSLDELIGSNANGFFEPEEMALAKEIQSNLLMGKEEHLPYTRTVLKNNCEHAFITVATNLISTNGHPDGFQHIGRDITNEVRMAENQQFYLKQVTNAHEEERLRISRDLHDSTAQELIAGLHQLEEFCKGHAGMPESDLNFLWALHGQLKETLQDVRRLSRDLRPSIIDDLGLLPAVEWLTEQAKVEHKIETMLEVTGDERRLAPEIEVALFRIVQEALRNVAKHAAATKATITISFKNNETMVAITDDGKGFEMPSSIGEFSRIGKLGIDGMMTRARLTGGTFNVVSVPSRGTSIVVTIPS